MTSWFLGPLLVLSAGVEIVKNRSLIIPVDNYGSVVIYKKGWCSSCQLCSTLALAISEVATSINCQLEIVKIRRCANDAAEACDAISKADWNRFRRVMPHANPLPACVPKVLEAWIQSPMEDRELGQKILREMKVDRNILGIHGMFK